MGAKGSSSTKGHEPSRPLSADDDVVALDNTAFHDGTEWKAEFVISVFNKLAAEKLQERVDELLRFVHIDPDDMMLDRIGKRAKFFFASPQREVEVPLQAEVGDEFVVGPTRNNGILSYLKRFGDHWLPSSPTLTFTVSGDYSSHNLSLRTIFAEESGWGIISGLPLFVKVTYNRY